MSEMWVWVGAGGGGGLRTVRSGGWRGERGGRCVGGGGILVFVGWGVFGEMSFRRSGGGGGGRGGGF